MDKFSVKMEEYTLNKLSQGEMFGEISMLYNCKKSATVKTLNYVTCGSLNRKQYQELLALYPSINSLLRKKIIMY